MSKRKRVSSKLMAYRIVTLMIIAFLFVQLGIVTDSMSSSRLGLYTFAVIIALPVTMLLDKYIVRFVKNG